MASTKPPTKQIEDGSIDAGLALLLLATPRGIERSQEEIAFVCGCTLQNIQGYEYRALKKIKAEFERRGLANYLNPAES